MRILLTADPFIRVPPVHYGGIERIIDSLVHEYQDRGHHVGLLAHPKSSCQANQLFSWSGRPGSADLVKHSLDLAKAVRSFTPDVCHSFSRLAYLFGVIRSPLAKIMSYQRQTGGWTVRISARLGRNLHFTGCSEYIASQGRTAGGEWSAIPNFIDADKLTFVPVVDCDAPLVFLSRLDPIKGCHTAIAIAKGAKRKLIIAGNRVETGSAAGYWEQQLKPHIDGTQVQYIGTVNDEKKNRLLGMAAAMIVPIEWDEPFGIVFAESLACGTPVISCARGALPEIVQDGIHGFHIRSVQEGIRAVGELSSIRRVDCRKRAEEKFTARVVASQYLKLYHQQVRVSRDE